MGKKFWLITNKGCFKDNHKRVLMLSDIQYFLIYFGYLIRKTNLVFPFNPDPYQKVHYSEFMSHALEFKLNPSDPSIINLTENGWSVRLDESDELIVPFLYHTTNGVKQQVPFFITTFNPLKYELTENIHYFYEGEGFVCSDINIEQGTLYDALIKFSEENFGVKISEYKNWSELGDRVSFDKEPLKDAEIYYSPCRNWEEFVLGILDKLGMEGKDLNGVIEYNQNAIIDMQDNRIMPDTEYMVFSGPVKGFFEYDGIIVEDKKNNIVITFPYLVSEYNSEWPICVFLLGRNHKIPDSVLEGLTNYGKIDNYSLNVLNEVLPIKVKLSEYKLNFL